MKSRKLLIHAIILNLCIIIGSASTGIAQEGHRPLLFSKQGRQNILQEFHSSEASPYILSEGMYGNAGILSPTGTQSRFYAISIYTYETSQYIATDSFRLHMRGNHNFNEYVPYFLVFLEAYPDLSLYTPSTDLISMWVDSTYDYIWDQGLNKFIREGKNLMTLDNNGNPVGIVNKHYTGGAWEKAEKTINTFNAQSGLNSQVEQDWNGTSWINDDRLTYTYNSQEKITLEVIENWDESSSSWIGNEKNIYTYNSAGKLTSFLTNEWSTTMEKWENNSRYNYAYADEKRITETLEVWNSATQQWENEEKIDYSYGNHEKWTEKVIWGWDTETDTWEKDNRESCTYNAAVQLIELLGQEWEDDTWLNTYKENYTYSGPNLTQHTFYEWENSSGQYVKYARAVMEYNSYEQCTALYSETWNQTEWAVLQGDIRFNFYYEELTSVVKPDINPGTFRLYPNPTREQITIVTDNGLPITNVKIINTSGQVVFHNKSILGATEITLPVSQLSSGVYFMRIKCGNTEVVKKFVVK